MRSEKGKGTKAIVTLTVGDKKDGYEESALRNVRILIIEDVPDQLEISEDSFEL